jgi:predicted dehydrogenase
MLVNLVEENMMREPVRVGVIGCGAISGAYLGMAKNFPIVEIAACSDLEMDRARAKAREFGIARTCDVDALLADPSIDIVLNLTTPQAHMPIGMRAIEAGKHTYSEKPLGVNREEGRMLLEAARARRVRVGCAPDTFMGAGIQTARHLIDNGSIGRPVGFTAFMLCPGHEAWHPSPEFYYEVGGGPMFDMGPYYLTALLNLLGPVKRFIGAASIAIPERTIRSEPKRGKKIQVRTPDHVVGTIEFECGAVGTIVTSFATHFGTYDASQPITIYGTEGTLKVSDPNSFDGAIHLRRPGDEDWQLAAHAFPVGYGRSIGLADLASAIRTARRHRTSGEQAFAVLDLMQGFLDSSESGRSLTPSTPYERPAAMRADLPFGALDE